MAKILVTGGLGFIGQHVVARLLADNHEVVVYDNRVADVQPEAARAVTFVHGDVRDRAGLDRVMSGVTAVVHLAAQVSVPESVAHPHETFEHNVIGTEAVFEAVRVAGGKRIVYASSAAVYGNTPKLPKEEADVLDSLSPYASSKEIDEHIAALYDRAYGVSALGLRFFNVYGPGQKADHAYASVIPRWVKAAKAGESLTVYGDGSQTRDFVHVRDVAGAIAAALVSTATGVCNIASGTELSLLGVVEHIARVTGVAPEVQHKPVRAGDIARSVASIVRAKRVLDWTPQVSFADGLCELLS